MKYTLKYHETLKVDCSGKSPMHIIVDYVYLVMQSIKQHFKQ